MNELLKMLEQMLNERGGGGEPHTMTEQEKQKKEQVQKDLEGFHSLVSAEEHKAVADLKTALETLVEVHNCNVDNIKCVNVTAQQAVHYATFGDIIVDVMKNIKCLETIDTKGAEALAEVRIENDMTYEKMAKAKFMNNMFKDLFGR